MKRCTKCGEEKVEGEFYLSVQRGKPYIRSQCKECEKARSLKWHRNNHKWIEAQRERLRFSQALKSSIRAALKHGYRPCNATEDEIREAFTGFCQNPGCLMPEAECKHRLSLDHNHKTGKFRGWLCSRCNRSAGLLGESTETILGLARYISMEGHCAVRTLDEV